jgi:hypothetical protein
MNSTHLLKRLVVDLQGHSPRRLEDIDILSKSTQYSKAGGSWCLQRVYIVECVLGEVETTSGRQTPTQYTAAYKCSDAQVGYSWRIPRYPTGVNDPQSWRGHPSKNPLKIASAQVCQIPMEACSASQHLSIDFRDDSSSSNGSPRPPHPFYHLTLIPRYSAVTLTR